VTDAEQAPAVTGGPRLLLRLEGAALLAVATFAFARTGASWWLYAILFLAPFLTQLQRPMQAGKLAKRACPTPAG
jgi:Domain of unknown function (DUF4260)